MRLKHVSMAVGLLCNAAYSPAHADASTSPAVAAASPVQPTVAVGSPNAGQRLSAFLRGARWLPTVLDEQGFYLPGLVFKRQALLQDQQLQQRQLLTSLYTQAESNPKGTAGESAYLTALVKALAPTGRLPLLSADADYLLAHPELDPTLQPGDAGTVPKRPNTVVVVGSGGICEVPYFAGVSEQTYATACFHGQTDYAFGKSIDTLWLVQPTGQVLKKNVGNWNAENAEIPMPGAWIVAPWRNSGYPAQTWQNLANYLATQGVATIPVEAAQAKPVVYATQKEFAERAATVPLRTLPISANDFGFVGLIQTPTARMREAGNFTFTASRVAPYTRYSFILQPFDWMEAGFRYTRITNRLYGPQSFSGNQTYLDKEIDLKFKLYDETPYLPQLAVGLQDIGGTGLFSGEYVVGNKRFGNFDTSLGLGWGYLGARGDHGNPFSLLGSKFNVRTNAATAQGGTLSTKDFFHGRTALFGGVQWHTPWERWTVKAEMDGNNYANEPLANPQVQNSAINYGVVYKVNSNVDFGVNVERGNTMGFVLSIHNNLSKFNTSKVADPKPVSPFATPHEGPVEWPKTLQGVKEQTNWDVTQVETRGSEVRLTVRNGAAAYYADSLDRASAVLNRDLPPNVGWFSFDYNQNGVNTGEHVVDRRQWVARHTDYTLNGFTRADNRSDLAATEGYDFPYNTVYEKMPERATSKFSIGYKQIFGGADGYLYQFNLANDSRLNLNQSTWLDFSLAYRLLGNFDTFTQGSNSVLPHVRTDIQKYAKGSSFNIPNLQLTHLGKLSSNVFYSVYGGLFEEMFAGVGGEVLYRPFNSRFALGVDANSVRQRGYNEDFSLLPYHVNTGHVTAYYDTGISDVLAKVSVGQYLAGDKGVTVDLSRVFNNGVKMGAFATKTNVSAAQFGEGSFDKGIYVQIPFSAFFVESIPGNAQFLWRPLTRDGGAKLNRTIQLFDQTKVRDPRAIEYRGGSGE
ncbi:YjbH domain-containing protein [Limnobacter litoralis]|nr:YjbH domain-containing protein [Limnobacter litoralis]